METVEMPVTVKLIYAVHESCGGKLEARGGPILLTSPEQYPHICLQCGKKVYVSGQKYPYASYTEIKELRDGNA